MLKCRANAETMKAEHGAGDDANADRLKQVGRLKANSNADGGVKDDALRRELAAISQGQR
jgi:hypothetical protein